MPDRSLLLPEASTDLLIQTIELPGARIAGSVLQDHYDDSAGPLLAAKLLVPDGYASAAAPLGDHDDAPVSLTWFPELNALGYLNASGTMVKVSPERISFFKADVRLVVDQLTTPLFKGNKRRPMALVEDTLWDLGEFDLDGRGRMIPLWFARRLYDNAEWHKVGQSIRDRPAPDLRIVMTTTLGHRLPSVIFQNHLMVPVSAILRHGAGLTIDRPILAARVKSPYDARDGPVRHSADYTSVSIRGKGYKFPGSKQRDVVRRLLRALEAGSPQCLTADVLQEAGFKDSVNTLAKAFSGRVDWKDFIAEGNGRCWAFL